MAVSPGNALAVTRHHESGPRGFGLPPVRRDANLGPPVDGERWAVPCRGSKDLVMRQHRPPSADSNIKPHDMRGRTGATGRYRSLQVKVLLLRITPCKWDSQQWQGVHRKVESGGPEAKERAVTKCEPVVA